MAISSWNQIKENLSDKYFASVRSSIFIISLFLIGFLFLVNWYFLHTLRQHYREVIQKEARLYAVAISENLNITELNWVFVEVLKKSKFPIIITDKYNNPVNWKNIHPGVFHNSDSRLEERVNFLQLPRQDQDYLKMLVKKFSQQNESIKLENETHFLGYFHYGEIDVIRWLTWLPLVEFLVFFLFIFFGYFSFKTIRTGEQSLLWVALAKETAHQMGTPLSSLMGWMEFLRLRLSKLGPDPKNDEILESMDGDISRLKKVSHRFSQIGSLPKLEKQSLNLLCKTTADYFTHRLPQLGKKIAIDLKLADIPEVWINHELIGWVLENLIKNALDSIKNKNGFIQIETFYAKAEQAVHITVTDNGKGIDRENWKKVFQTGYSTKKRGWGLGLSLAKRIITIYHGGTIEVEWSSKYHGTKFRIVLPLLPERVKKQLNDEWKKANSVGG